MKSPMLKLGLICVVAMVAMFCVFQLAQADQRTIDPDYAHNMLMDDTRQKIYLSNWSQDYLQVFSMTTLENIGTIPVGLGPTGMDISPDGNELAVALSNESKIAFVDLEAQVVTQTITPNVEHPDLPNRPNEPLSVIYGRTGRLYSSGGVGFFDYIHIVDTTSKVELSRSEDILIGHRLHLSTDLNSLYVFMNGGIRVFDVSSDTAVPSVSIMMRQYSPII